MRLARWVGDLHDERDFLASRRIGSQALDEPDKDLGVTVPLVKTKSSVADSLNSL